MAGPDGEVDTFEATSPHGGKVVIDQAEYDTLVAAWEAFDPPAA